MSGYQRLRGQAVGLAGLALAQVTAKRSASQGTAAPGVQLATDLLARGVARVTVGDQRRPRLEDQRLHLAR